MALRYDLTKITDYETVCYDGENQKPITTAIIQLGMAAGYGRLTEKNAAEMHRRVTILGELWGAPVTKGDGTSVYISEADMRAHVGLVMNAVTLTKSEFDTRVAEERAKLARTR